MELSKLIIPSKTVAMEYPGCEGFKISVAYLTRDEILNLRKKATTSKFNKRTRQPEEDIDSELFQEIYIKAVIKGWTGLKYKFLPKLLPVDLSTVPAEEFKDGEGEFAYTVNSAIALMKNCTDFDNWISTELEDVENFTQNS